MIFSKQGVPLNEVLQSAALGRTEHDAAQRRLAGRPRLERNNKGEPIYRILKTKLGDAYRVFRAVFKDTGRSGEQLRMIRATHGVGRPQWMWKSAAGRSFEAYGRGPAMDALPLVRAYNALPPEERAYASARLVEERDKAIDNAFLTAAGEIDLRATFAQAVSQYGSQRKAAAALGISLGKLQRELRKCASQ